MSWADPAVVLCVHHGGVYSSYPAGVTATLEHYYAPRGAAKALMESRAPEVLASGPAGTGKSRAALEKLNLVCLRNPGAKCLIVRKTAVSLTTSALTTYRELVAKEAIACGAVRFYGGSRQTPPQYQYHNGSVINIGGMDAPTRVMSTEYDLIFAQEAIELTVDDWEALSSRLRHGRVSFQQLVADTNPAQPTHWLKERCNRGDCLLLESRHEDNPRLFNADGTSTAYGRDYIARLDRLTGVRYQRLRLGKWVAAEGQIWERWDAAVHVVPRFPIPGEWTRYWAVDFGFTNPFVWQDWAIDGDGRMYLTREVYQTRRTVDEHAAAILDVVSEADPARPGDLRVRRWREPRPRYIICDHDAEGRQTLSNALGIGTIPADKRVIEGIQAVDRRLRRDWGGKPGLVVLADSVVSRDQDLVDAKKPIGLTEEVPGYVWAIKPGGDLKEEPSKVDDHSCDAARYTAMHLEAGSPMVRYM